MSFRIKGNLFISFIYTVSIGFILCVCWLFLSNTLHTSKEGIAYLFSNHWFLRSIKLSILTSSITTVIAIVLGIPAAYALSRFNLPCKRFIDILFSSVIVLPASTIGLCLMVAFQYEPVLKLQQALGFRIVHSVPSIVIAQLVLSLAIGIRAWRCAFDDVSPRFEHVARSLGGSMVYNFFNVTLPAAKTGLMAGVILAWTRAMAEFGAVLILSSTFRNRDGSQFSGLVRFLGIDRADILSVGMWMEMESGKVESGVAIAFTLLLITAITVYIFNKLGNGRYFIAGQ